GPYGCERGREDFLSRFKVLLRALSLVLFVNSSASELATVAVWGVVSWARALISAFAVTGGAAPPPMYTAPADTARCRISSTKAMTALWSGVVLAAVFCGTIGAIAAAAAGDQNWFVAAADVNPVAWVYILLLVVIVADNLFINVMNLYTGGFAIVNIFPN